MDDANDCTADSCDPETGVSHDALPAGTSCSDGDACNGAEQCDGAGLVSRTPLAHCSSRQRSGGNGIVAASFHSANNGTCACSHPTGTASCGVNGHIRLEAFQHNWSYNFQSTPYTTGSPVSTFIPPGSPSISVVGIANQPVPALPNGAFDVADVTLPEDTEQPVDVEIVAHYVPVGTTPTLYIYSLEGNDQTLTAEPLEGTLETSATTVQVAFPTGYSRGWVRAVWTPEP